MPSQSEAFRVGIRELEEETSLHSFELKLIGLANTLPRTVLIISTLGTWLWMRLDNLPYRNQISVIYLIPGDRFETHNKVVL